MTASELRRNKIVSTKSEVIDILKNNLDNFALFGVTKIGLFGSFVREEHTLDSDIDLLVHLQSSSWDNYCQLLDFAEALFPERKVDIITRNSIDGYAGINIGREVEYVS